MRHWGVLLVAGFIVASCGGSSSQASVGESDPDDPLTAVLDQFGIDADDGDDGDAGTEAESGTAPGEGGATVQIGDIVLQVEQGFCLHMPGFFQFDGVGTDGTDTAWVEINGGTDEDYDEDGVNDGAATVVVDYGWEDSTEPKPDLQADVVQFSSNPSVSDAMFDFTIDGNTMSGSGVIQDYAGVLLDFGEQEDLRFSATCA